MKFSVMLLKILFVTILSLCLLSSCKKNDASGSGGSGGGGGNPSGVSPEADSISDHLQFSKATKKNGAIPKGPAASSLKISFEDTLYLVDEVKLPIKFQHLDTTQNVSGIFLQVAALINGSFVAASQYYDIPEVPDLDSSDTVSVILIGINPTGLQLPLSFNVTITPYNSSGLPIAQATRPVKILPHKINPKGTGGSCGLVTINGITWDWVMSYMDKSNFTSTPEKVWGADGQNIKGSCCAGISIYGFCPGDTLPNAHLHFNTSYQIGGEQFTFTDDGHFYRRTVETGAIPLPDSSNFCDPYEGRVKPYTLETLYFGNYTVAPAIIPHDLQSLHDSLGLFLQTTITDPKGAGYGNSGGIIHYQDCRSLVLIQADLEGFGQHLYKIYQTTASERWFEFP
ncbi:MAG: hypothetical protein ABI472_06320 [Ginsengibacter sp.]